MCVGIITEGNKVVGVELAMGTKVYASAVVLTNGTFLNGLIHLGEKQYGGGRAGEKAHAILLLPRDMITAGDARKRIHAIKEHTALGSGFKIAMRDLEIRGAGNLLGTKQSGHISQIGFDLYCQLLKQSVERLKGRKSGSTTPPSF